MPIAKSQIIPMIEDAFAKETTPGRDLSGTSLAFSPQRDMLVLRTKASPAKKCTPKQLWQRSMYRDADCFWRCITPAQRAKWTEFYNDHENEWKGMAGAPKKAATAKPKLKTKDLSQRSLFFKRALRFNLEPFLSKYLCAAWHVTSITKENGTWKIEAKIISTAEQEPTDYLDEQQRLIRVRW